MIASHLRSRRRSFKYDNLLSEEGRTRKGMPTTHRPAVHRFYIPRPRAFRLAAAREFFAGFTPGSGMAALDADELSFALHLDDGFVPAVVAVRERDDRLEVEVVGSRDEAAVCRQLGRMLGLECDAVAWRELGRRAPLVGALQREFPGFLTAAKPSAYDAAAWSIVAARVDMRTAARMKTRIAEAHGTAIHHGGRVHHVFPTPRVLCELPPVPGLAENKRARLRALGEAAGAGLLDVERLRALGETEALALLQQLPGIGPWSAGHIYHRGAAPPDGLPRSEPRVFHGLAHASGRDSCDADDLVRAAAAWRPYRMWVCVLLARHLARAGGWHAPSLRAERAAAARHARATPARFPSPRG